ncbi:MAG: hypothetical protein P1P89_13155 [Desulfobacterales bacterium]|nr:hypothetical protein [Desulfobacterales bacterium]
MSLHRLSADRQGIAPSPREGRTHPIEALPHGSDPAQVPLNHPQKIDSHGEDDRLCLLPVNAKVGGVCRAS